MCWGETTRYKVWVMSFIFKTSSLEFSPLSICIKQDVLTDNKPSVFKDFMFWGLTIPIQLNKGMYQISFFIKTGNLSQTDTRFCVFGWKT